MKFKKTDTLTYLKLLTKYLISSKDNNEILNILNLQKQNHSLFLTRCFVSISLYPQLIQYFDKHFNNIYDFNKYDFKIVLRNISKLFNNYNIKTNQLNFIKISYNNDRTNFIKLINDYYNDLSENDINNLYKLFVNQNIFQKHLDNIIQFTNNKFKLTCGNNDIKNEIINLKEEVNKNEIQLYIEKMIDYIKNRKICKNCPMYSNRSGAILDTNLKNIEEVDIVFQGLNPGKTEHEQSNVFVGRSGKLLRKYINEIVNKHNLSYLITNTILCWSNDSKSIKNINNVLKRCKYLNNITHKTFKPKLTVLLGNDALSSFGYKRNISTVNGKLIDKNIFAMYHPSYILRNKTKLDEFEKAFIKLEKLIIKINSESTSFEYDNEEKIDYGKKYNVNNIITSFDNNYSLADITILKEDVIFILSDDNGIKHYLIKPVKIPCYIKPGSYIESDYITDEKINTVCYLSSEEKKMLTKKLYYKLQNKVIL